MRHDELGMFEAAGINMIKLRTAEAATSIYNSGMRYLRLHVLLCKLSMRTTRALQIRLSGSNLELFARRGKLAWQVRPKIHVPLSASACAHVFACSCFCTGFRTSPFKLQFSKKAPGLSPPTSGLQAAPTLGPDFN